MKNEVNKKKKYVEIPDRMFQDVKIPEDLAPTPINPAIDEANQHSHEEEIFTGRDFFQGSGHQVVCNWSSEFDD